MLGKHTLFAVLGFVSILSVAAHSQECTDLARVMARESERFSDKNQVDILNIANLCSSEYEKSTSEQRAQIEASYGLFSGGAKGSADQIREMQKQRCEGKYGSEWRNRITSNDIQRVSQVGADVVRACLNSRTFRLVDLTIADEALMASFRYNGAGETILNGIIVTPPEIAKCSALYNGKNITNLSEISGSSIKSGETIALDCRRISTSIGNNRNNYRGGVVGIATSAEVAQVPLIAYSSPPVDESTAESLAGQLKELKGDFASYKAATDGKIAAGQKIAAGHWNGSQIDFKTSDNLVTASKPNWYAVRLNFDQYKFSTPPIVMLSSGEYTRSFIENLNNQYVDIKNQGFNDAKLNGKQSPEQQFWFAIIPTDR